MSNLIKKARSQPPTLRNLQAKPSPEKPPDMVRSGAARRPLRKTVGTVQSPLGG